jgi:hypothetical protein
VYAVRHGGVTDTFTHVLSVAALGGGGGASVVFATGGTDGAIHAWDSRQPFRPNAPCGTIRVAGAPQVGALAALPDAAGGGSGMGLLVARCDDGTLRLYDTRMLAAQTLAAPSLATGAGGAAAGSRVALGSKATGSSAAAARGPTPEVAAALAEVPYMFDTAQLAVARWQQPPHQSSALVSGVLFTAGSDAVCVSVSAGTGFAVASRLDTCSVSAAAAPAAAREQANGMAVDAAGTTAVCGTQNGSLRAFVTSVDSPLLQWKFRREAASVGGGDMRRQGGGGTAGPSRKTSVRDDAADDTMYDGGDKVRRVEQF